MKRLIFLTSFDYPSRYAHAIHGLYMARAFHAQLGENFLFMVNTVIDDTLLGIPHRLLFGRFGRRVKLLHLRSLLLPFSLARFFRTHPLWQGSETMVFVNDPKLIAMAVWLKRKFGTPFMYESHGLLSNVHLRELTVHAHRVIFLTSFLERAALDLMPNLAGRTQTTPNAVDVGAFDRVSGDQSRLRKELDLPEGFLIGYVGRFAPMGEDKGLKLMIRALVDLPPMVRLVLVGGAKKEIAEYAAYAHRIGMNGRVTLVPHVQSELVPRYEKACDLLAYVPYGGSEFFEKETSPMKIFEYLASGRPAILSDIPTARTIVPAQVVYFVSRGSSEAYIDAVKEVLANPTLAREKAKQALLTVREQTWDNRANRILAF